MSEKWIPWKSNLISSWEVKTDQASFNAPVFPVFTEYPSSAPNRFSLSVLLSLSPRRVHGEDYTQQLFLMKKESGFHVFGFHDLDQFLDRIINRTKLSSV